ncbi:uncharacterized protein LOC120418381 [Culex pipiens pallens]|uniref:uncharacterized protein LOC120418381 n=1 Tax=Culex pipiens pallens TaxID=42434 RepID=UPI001952F356|nr:uncharacterized protein LOC120418381 [Culex pipiens pallens]
MCDSTCSFKTNMHFYLLLAKPRVIDDYRNNPEDFELPNPIVPGVSNVKCYAPIKKISKDVDKSKAVSAIAETFSPPPKPKRARAKRPAKRRTALDLERIVADGSPHPMIIVPTTKGCVGLSHGNHHYEHHFGRKNYRMFRCAWHSSHCCPAQVVAFEKQYVMSVKGSAQLMINGYTFTRHIVKDDTIYWRCTQFQPEVTYITSRKGTLQLEIDRYRFTRQKICKSTIRWECLQTKALCCKARATTNNAVRGAVYYFNNEHNHPPQMERRKADIPLETQKCDESQNADDVDTCYVISRKGTPQLMIDGHCYSRQRVRDRTIRWRCVQFKPLNCMARATTERQNGGKLISISGQHNHDLIRERRKNGELKELLAIRQAERGQRPAGDQPEEQFYVQNLREVHAVLSNRGKVQLMIDGFPFSREKVRPKTIRWICNQAWILNCKVRATSERTNGEIISVRGTHNHVVVNNRRQRGECKVIKEHARLYGPEQSEPRRKGGRPRKRLQ